MAADTNQQTSSPTTGEGGGEPAAQKSRGGGFAAYLPLVLAIVIMPTSAWFIIDFKVNKAGKKSAGAETDEHAEPAKGEESSSSHGGGAHGGAKGKDKGKSTKKERNTKLPIPLTRNAITFIQKDPDKEGDFDKIVVSDHKGETKDLAQAENIVVNAANSPGHYVVAQFSVLGDHPELITRLNENRERLIDIAIGTLSSKSLDEIEKPGFRNILRSELLALFNQVLGSGTLQDIVITKFVTQ